MQSYLIAGTLLLIVAVTLIWRNLVMWRGVLATQPDARQRDFYYRQYRRRWQANVMIALVALAVMGGGWVPQSLVFVFYWLGVLLLILWIIALALADMISSRVYFQQLHSQQMATRAALREEMQRICDTHGKPTSPPAPSEDSNGKAHL